MYYRYYQTSQEAKWHLIPDGPGVADKASEEGAKKLTILAVSEDVNDSTPLTSLSYKGPLYFDIDCKEDIQTAIESSRALVRNLKKAGVPDEYMQAYCSGSKGLHIIVNQQAFSSGRAVRMLPWVYGTMAQSLQVFGLDFQVYSSKKGNCWRLPNTQRDDGKYRVPITLEELEDLDVDKYQTYVAAPRTHIDLSWPGVPKSGNMVSTDLTIQFEKARVEAKTRIAKHLTAPSLNDEESAALRKSTPKCITELCSGNTTSRANFNETAFQLGIYCNQAGLSKDSSDSFCGQLAENSESSQYSSSLARYAHAQGTVNYAGSGKYKFSCGAMRNILKVNPCEGCPVNIRGDNSEATDGSGIIQKEDGYYSFTQDGGERQLTTFVLNVLEHHASTELDDVYGGAKRSGVTVRVKAKMLNCKGVQDVFLSEESWLSRGNLIRELSGMGALSVYGSDTDVQRIKHFIFIKFPEAEADVVMDTDVAGILHHKIGNQSMYVYCEPSGSIDQMGVQDTYRMSGIPSAPIALKQRTPESYAEHSLALDAMCKMNDRAKMGIIIGWAVACHLKAHIMESMEGFPVLNLWGSFQSGKNQTIERVVWLNGVDYTSGESDVINVGASTTWPTIHSAMSTTTVPRIFDEYNLHRMRAQRAGELNEILKCSWASSSIPRGVLGSNLGRTNRLNARTINLRMSAPIVALSEQPLTLGAVKSRSLQVAIARTDRDNAISMASYPIVVGARDQLMQVSKQLVLAALATETQAAHDLVEAQDSSIPDNLVDRPRHAYKVALAGMQFLINTCTDLGFSSECLDTLRETKQSAIDSLSQSRKEIAHDKGKTEVDTVLGDFGFLAFLQSTDTGKVQGLEEGLHYSHGDGKLAIDLAACYPLYQSWVSRERTSTHIKDRGVFEVLVRQEPYFILFAKVQGFCLERPALVLDIDKMVEKGIDMSLWGCTSGVNLKDVQTISIGLR